MPTVTRVITTTSTNVTVETINQLHTELSVVGLSVVGVEVGATQQFGEATSVQLKAFQQRYNLTVDGNLTPETGGMLSLAALVAGESDLAKLREKLKVAANAVPGSSQYNYWTARYALMTGDFVLAAQVMPSRFPDLLGVDLHNLVLTVGVIYGIPEQPEVPLPENYYSYRYSVMSQSDIDALRQSAQQTLVPWIYRRPNNGSTDTFDPPHWPTVFNPPSAITLGLSRQQRLINSTLAWLNAIEAWQFGNAEFASQRFASAADAYDRCQNYILEYFSVYPDYAINFTTSTLAARVDELIWSLVSNNANWAQLWSQINWRRALLSLKELSQLDWTAIDSGSTAYQLLQKSLAGQDATAFQSQERKTLIDARVLVIAAVLAPLARGEANRLRRQYSVAIDDFTRVLRNSIPVPNVLNSFAPAPLKCEFIETPFARLLLIETLLDQAEAQYKSRLSVDDEPDADKKSAALAQLGLLAQDFTSRQIEGDATGNAANPFQHLVAALTYSSAIDAGSADSDYVANTKQALNSLHATVKTAVTNGDVRSKNFRAVGHTVTIPNVRSATKDLPGLTAGTHPHEPYLSFEVPKAEVTGRSNPRVYALLMQAQSRLLQIWSGFNYLGYRDDYVPPWRFSYLLDRARYFSEHAKNAQRDYLNFLNNAENEEFKEMSAAQNVELEKANVQIETARMDQATDEVAAANESATLADLNAKDAKRRLEDYISFENWMRVFDNMSVANSIEGGIFSLDPFKVSETATDIGKAGAQRGNEEFNLRLAINEANQAQLVAMAQLNVAQAGLVVAGLQRQAALLRHEFALQNLQFMRNQILNTEQWYRMAGAIRSVGDTYLRYAIQMAFLAQQAYNFEADKRLYIIRFDYDLSDVGAMLAADFLLRDLDTLEQDLVVSQQTRLQQVRYVLSLAREFPETLRALADTGEVMFNMRLEQLERHFPGLVNLRISNVDLLPVALMDPTRVSVQLTHLGVGMVRLKSQPGSSPLNDTDLAADGDWLPNAADDWPVKIPCVRVGDGDIQWAHASGCCGRESDNCERAHRFRGPPRRIELAHRHVNGGEPGCTWHTGRCPDYICPFGVLQF